MLYNIPCRSNPMPFYTEPPSGIDYSKLPITFENIGNGTTTINLQKYNSPYDVNLKYKKRDDTGWTSYTLGNTISLTGLGDYVSFSGSNTLFSKGFNSTFGAEAYYSFNTGGSYNQIVYGNIMSLVNWQTQVGDLMFVRLFENTSNLVDASNLYLPDNTGKGCYVWLFRNSYVSAVPEFKAPSLASGCYWAMFNSATKVQKCKIDGTQLNGNCFQITFNGASALSAVEVKFTSWDIGVFTGNGNWMGGISTTGIFVKPSALPVAHGTDRIPSNWIALNRLANGSLQVAETKTWNGQNYTSGQIWTGEDPFADSN